MAQKEEVTWMYHINIPEFMKKKPLHTGLLVQLITLLIYLEAYLLASK